MCFVHNFLKFDMTCWSMGCKIDVVFAGRNFILMKLNSASKSSSKPGGCPGALSRRSTAFSGKFSSLRYFFTVGPNTSKIHSVNMLLVIRALVFDLINTKHGLADILLLENSWCLRVVDQHWFNFEITTCISTK